MKPIKHLRETVDRLIEWGAAALYLLSVVFVLAMAARLVYRIAVLWLHAQTVSVLIELLDPILLLVMLAELLHTIALTIKTRHLPLRPPLAVVFLAILRHAVVAASTTSLASFDAAATGIGLVVLSILLWKIPDQAAD